MRYRADRAVADDDAVDARYGGHLSSSPGEEKLICRVELRSAYRSLYYLVATIRAERYDCIAGNPFEDVI